MNKYLMTALCALGVAGAALADPAPRHAGRGHHDSPTKIFQKTAAHELGHVVGDAAEMGVALVGAAVAQAAGLGTPPPAPPPPAPPPPAPVLVVQPPPTAPVLVVQPPRRLPPRPVRRLRIPPRCH